MPGSIPENIRSLREDRDLTQTAVARHLGVSQQTYSSYELGCSAISSNHLAKLALFYGVSADYLLGLTAFEKPAGEMNQIYAKGEALGRINTHMLNLSPEHRKMLVDYLGFLTAMDKEEKKKRKRKK